MKKIIFYHILVVVVSFALVVGLLVYASKLDRQDSSLAAVTASMSLPSTLVFVDGQQLTLPIRLDTGGNTVIGVDVDLMFDNTLLKLVDIVNTSKVYPLMLPQVSGDLDKSKIITTANTIGRVKTSLVAANANGEPTAGYSGQLVDPLYELYFDVQTVSASRTTNIELVHSPGGVLLIAMSQSQIAKETHSLQCKTLFLRLTQTQLRQMFQRLQWLHFRLHP